MDQPSRYLYTGVYFMPVSTFTLLTSPIVGTIVRSLDARDATRPLYEITHYVPNEYVRLTAVDGTRKDTKVSMKTFWRSDGWAVATAH